MNQTKFDYSQIRFGEIVSEIEAFRTYESEINAQDNLSERKIKERFSKFLNDGGFA